MRFHESDAVLPLRERLAEILCDYLGARKDQAFSPASFIEDIGGDSLDHVELIMELEEEFDVTIPDDAAEKIRTVGDVVDYIIRNRSK